MANIDLGGADAQRIRNRYQTSLQRDASDDEVSGWLSGSYGGGGIDQWENQIAQSDEARQRGTYKPPTTTPPDGTVVGQTGQNTTQNNQGSWDPNTGMGTPESGYGPGGVNNPAYQGPGSPNSNNTTQNTGPQSTYKDLGWWASQGVSPDQIFDTRTGQIKPGWQRTGNGYERGGATSGWDVDPKGNYQNWFLQNTSSLPPSGKALESLAPYLSKYGIKLGGRNAAGMIDTIITPDGRAWDVIESATMDGGKRWQWIPAGGHSGTTGGNYTGSPGVGGGALPGNQYSDQYTQLLEGLIKSRIGQLQQPYFDPNRAAYEQALKSRADALGMGNQQLTQLMDYLQKRFTELQGPGYTGAEGEVIRTGALDPIEQDRSAAKKRVLERLSARGLNPDSGIAQQALLEVDKAFDAVRGTTQTTLTTNDLARREDRQQRAEKIGGQMVDINDARSREQLDVFQALEMLSQTMRDEEEARSREAIGYAGGLNDLSAQRLQLAMQAAGMGGNPSSLLSGLTGIANMNQQASMFNRSQQGNMWSGLGSIMAILAGSR